jgi:hypothetical protein
VFSLRNSEDRDDSERARLADDYAPPRLFGADVTYQKLASLLARGAEIKTIRLSARTSASTTTGARTMRS